MNDNPDTTYKFVFMKSKLNVLKLGRKTAIKYGVYGSNKIVENKMF